MFSTLSKIQKDSPDQMLKTSFDSAFAEFFWVSCCESVLLVFGLTLSLSRSCMSFNCFLGGIYVWVDPKNDEDGCKGKKKKKNTTNCDGCVGDRW